MEDLRRIKRFDQNEYSLGTLCKKGHDFEGTGKSLRSIKHRHCIECKRESWRKSSSTEKVKEYQRSRYRSGIKQILTDDQKKRRAELARIRRQRNELTDEQKARRSRWQYEYKLRKMESDPLFRIKEILRHRLRNAVSAYGKGKKRTSKEYGIDLMAIARHLGPCPGEKKDYEIDHIIPLAAFDFSDDEQIRKAFAPENHQWLLKEQNRKKGAKLPSEYES